MAAPHPVAKVVGVAIIVGVGVEATIGWNNVGKAAKGVFDWARSGNTAGDASCPACTSSERMGQALMKGNDQARGQGQQQGQGQSNTASPNPNDNDKKPFGARGTQTTSTTVGSGKGWRVDVENPNPGQRPGQIHYQSGKTKFLYDPSTKSFVGASKTQNRQLLNDPSVQRSIKKGLKVLGENQ